MFDLRGGAAGYGGDGDGFFQPGQFVNGLDDVVELGGVAGNGGARAGEDQAGDAEKRTADGRAALPFEAGNHGENGEGEREGVGGNAESGEQAALAGDVEQGQDGEGEDAQQEGGGAGGRAGAAAFFRGCVVVEGGVFSER